MLLKGSPCLNINYYYYYYYYCLSPRKPDPATPYPSVAISYGTVANWRILCNNKLGASYYGLTSRM